MAFIRLNENPYGLDVGDCVVRAISTALNYNWFMVHDDLSFLSRKMADMPSSNRVWKEYLRDKGWIERTVDTNCPNCMTLKDFCRTHSKGRFIVSLCEMSVAQNNIIVTGSHLIAVINGDYYDTRDSGAYVPLSYFYYSRN